MPCQVIDEVHERSVDSGAAVLSGCILPGTHIRAAVDSILCIDSIRLTDAVTDILCMLARRLLERNPKLKLVLMSATIHTELYRKYFSDFLVGTQFVGARRFPVAIHYALDLPQQLNLPSRLVRECRDLAAVCKPGQTDAPSQAAKLQHNLAFWVTRLVTQTGSSAVLVFVSGIADIEEILGKFEELETSKEDPKYVCIPIHSDIPFEDQLAAFKPVAPGKVKVVVATNAAESSITLPDVDHVICLGTHKQVRYNERHHQTQLVNTWVSKASATQRAGRTGRVRPGTVWRLYSEALFDAFTEHECAEIHRQPLDATLLQLRAMLNQAVVPILKCTLEPPEMTFVDNAFRSLHDMNMITSPDDDGQLT
jgi:HrpA-like RNA helicase